MGAKSPVLLDARLWQAVYTSNFIYDKFSFLKYACPKAGMPVLEKVHLSYEKLSYGSIHTSK